MFSKTYILVATVLLGFSLNESLAESYFENLSGKLLIQSVDKTCALTADVAKWNQKKANSVPKLDDVVFELRTPCPTQRFTMSEAANLLKAAGFDANKKTVGLISSDMADGHVIEMAEGYNCRDDYNFVVIDVSKSIVSKEYINDAINVDILGSYIATGLANTGIDSAKINLVGHGLAAHIAGSAGSNFFKNTGKPIARITGLDPIRPCFKSGVLRSLQRDDADYVDVIHSNVGALGLEDPIGKSDFYPGGMDMVQPGCNARLGCSHDRAYQYFIETLVPGKQNNFMAAKCNDIADVAGDTCTDTHAPMGILADKGEEGIFTLPVNNEMPYGLNDNGEKPTKQCKVCLDHLFGPQ